MSLSEEAVQEGNGRRLAIHKPHSRNTTVFQNETDFFVVNSRVFCLLLSLMCHSVLQKLGSLLRSVYIEK